VTPRQTDTNQADILRTLPGETAPVRQYAPNIWRQGSLIALERVHLAFHRLAAAQSGGEAISQRVSVTGPLGGPLDNTRPEDLRASAETVVREAGAETQGAQPSDITVYKEWAAFTGLRNLLLGAGWARVVRTAEPFVSTSGAGLASVLQARSAIDALKQPSGQNAGIALAGLPALWDWVNHPRSALWQDIKDAFAELGKASSALLSNGFFAAQGIVSASVDVVKVYGVGDTSESGKLPNEAISITVEQMAGGMSIRSQDLPDGALGLQGTIRVGDKELYVSPGDNAAAIVSGINGLAQGVTASLEGAKMRLSSQKGLLPLGDPDGVLAGLGFFDAAGVPTDIVQVATPAVIKVNGVEMRSWNGKFRLENLGVDIEAKSAGQTTLSVGSREHDVVAGVEAFVSAYNKAVGLLNRGIMASGRLTGNRALQGIGSAVVSSLLGPVQGPPDNLDEAKEVGITVNRGAARSFESVTLQMAAMRKASMNDNNRFPIKGLTGGLDSMGVVLQSDYTAVFDAGKFVDVFRRSPEGVRDVFAGVGNGDGVARRISEIASSAVRADSGLMDMTAVTAARFAVEKPWAAYAEAIRRSAAQVISFVV
jgi:hypothetical protein